MIARVRVAQAVDGAAVGEVFVLARAGMTYLPIIHTEAKDRAHFAAVTVSEDTWVAVTPDGQVVGFAAASPDRLDHLYVVPEAQGAGIGSALLARVTHERPGGFDLWVFQQNVGARRFYERHGLVLVEETDGASNMEGTPDARYKWRAGILKTR